MRKGHFFGLIVLIVFIIGLACADQMTFTTYYPAPYGVYKEMNVHYLDFRNDEYQETFPSNMPAHEDARICYDKNEKIFKYSQENTWHAFGGGGVPAGSVMAYMSEVVPVAWLECDGSSVSKDAYPALFTAIGYKYGGAGDNFNLPDLRGYFLRGWDHGAGKDPDTSLRTDRGDGIDGDNIGTKQDDKFKSHAHSVSTDWFVAGTDNDRIVLSTGGVSGKENVDATGGSETRPKNIYVMYIIKAN